MLSQEYPMPRKWQDHDGRVGPWVLRFLGPFLLFIGLILVHFYFYRYAMTVALLLLQVWVIVQIWLQYIGRVLAPRRSLETARLTELPGSRMSAIYIPTDPKAVFALFTLTITAAPGALLAIVIGVIHPRDGFRAHIFFFVLVCAAVVVVVGGMVWLLTLLVPAPLARGLWLAADGVHHRLDAGHVFIPWESIELLHPGRSLHLTVTLKPGEGDTRQNWLARLLTTDRRGKTILPEFFSIHPTVVYYAIAFYHRNPDLRSELGTEEGLRRLQRIDYPEIISEVRQHGRVRDRADQ